MKKVHTIFLSLCYTGFTPKCPGTVASIATTAILIFVSLLVPASLLWRLLILIIVFIIVYWLALRSIAATVKGTYDQQWIVIDEFLGMLIAVAPFFVFNTSWQWFIVALAFFRFFDITKLLGLKKINKLNTSQAVILDDVIAGVYTAFLSFVIYYILNHIVTFASFIR